MAYKIMVIDDARDRREQYRKVFSNSEFEPLFIWTQQDLERNRDTPVDGYVIDVFLSGGDWANSETNAAELLRTHIQTAPRSAPVFLVSQLWGDERVLDILKLAGESSVKVVQYLAWSEFQQATEENDTAESRMYALRNKLLFELNRWHGRSGFRPEPDAPIRILLIADVQFGDPKTDPQATFSEHWIAHKLKEDNALPDLIVVAGDVSHSGRPDQFALAGERLALDLMGPLWGNNNIDRMRDRIVLVPGNHDVNLRFSACDNRRYDLDTKKFQNDELPALTTNTSRHPCHHDYALEPFRRFARQLTRDRNWDDSTDLSWVDRRFLHLGIRFFVLNTVTSLNSSIPDSATISEDTVRKISRSLADDSESVFNIAVSHHGLRPEGALDTEKQIDNWNTVGRDLFTMHDIRLWLYGHYHEFHARSLNGEPFNEKPLWLVQIPTPRISYTKRGFCLLELHREAGKICDAVVHHYPLENSKIGQKSTHRVFDRG